MPHMQTQTIPRLELLAALLLAKLVVSVTSALKSKIVLNDPDLSQIQRWHYIALKVAIASGKNLFKTVC